MTRRLNFKPAIRALIGDIVRSSDMATADLKPLAREPVEATPRRSMTAGRKLRIHTREKGKCWMCGKPVPTYGPEVRYDHRLPLELGGSDDDANVFPLHAEPCDRLKTMADRRRIDKARRQRAMSAPREPSRLQGRGFDKAKTRGFDGKVRERARS